MNLCDMRPILSVLNLLPSFQISVSEESIVFSFKLGVVLLEQQKGVEALRYFNKALKINPEHRVSTKKLQCYTHFCLSFNE